MGPATIQAITQFQRIVEGQLSPNGLIEPGDEILCQLKKAVPLVLTADVLQAVMPGANTTVITRYFHPLIDGMTAHDINTPLRKAHFLAQIGHESCDFVYSEELGNGNAYEDRLDLGNTQPGDGPKFKGRGLIQITGRANYTAYGQYKGQDFITPTNYLLLATDPELAVDASCWFWTKHGLNQSADNDDLTTITKKINGGLNGFADRRLRLTRAKCLLQAPA